MRRHSSRPASTNATCQRACHHRGSSSPGHVRPDDGEAGVGEQGPGEHGLTAAVRPDEVDVLPGQGDHLPLRAAEPACAPAFTAGRSPRRAVIRHLPSRRSRSSTAGRRGRVRAVASAAMSSAVCATGRGRRRGGPRSGRPPLRSLRAAAAARERLEDGRRQAGAAGVAGVAVAGQPFHVGGQDVVERWEAPVCPADVRARFRDRLRGAQGAFAAGVGAAGAVGEQGGAVGVAGEELRYPGTGPARSGCATAAVPAARLPGCPASRSRPFGPDGFCTGALESGVRSWACGGAGDAHRLQRLTDVFGAGSVYAERFRKAKHRCYPPVGVVHRPASTNPHLLVSQKAAVDSDHPAVSIGLLSVAVPWGLSLSGLRQDRILKRSRRSRPGGCARSASPSRPPCATSPPPTPNAPPSCPVAEVESGDALERLCTMSRDGRAWSRPPSTAKSTHCPGRPPLWRPTPARAAALESLTGSLEDRSDRAG